MHELTLPVLVFAGYFLILAWIGFRSSRVTSSDSDYWIAGGRLGWLTGGATLAATHTSAGSLVGTIGVIYTVGWSFGWLVLSIPISFWFMAAVLAPRFTRQGQLTLPAFLGARYYSRKVRGLSATIILLATVIYIQAQIVAGGVVASVVLGIPATKAMIVFTVVLVAYTMIGGMVAVVYTDLMQLLVMVTGVVLALPIAIDQLGGLDNLLQYAQAVNPQMFRWDSLPPTLLLTMGLAFALGSVSSPEKLVRLYAMKDMPTIRRGVLLAMVIATSINLAVFVLALASVVLFPGLDSGDQAMPLIARSLMPPVLGSLLLAAVTAAMMSTVDSLLVVAGSALSLDVCRSFLGDRVQPRQRQWIDRLGIVAVGTAPLVLVLAGIGEGELVQFIVLLYTALMAASFFVPVVLGVYWRRATREGATAAMIGGAATTFLWKAFGPPEIDPVLPGFMASGILMVGVSLLTSPPPLDAVDPYFPSREAGRNGSRGS